jgi:glutamine amidotransferase PdxT
VTIGILALQGAVEPHARHLAELGPTVRARLVCRAEQLAGLSGIKILKARHGADAVWLEEGRIWATTFHPELSRSWPSPFHREFASRCAADR